MEETKGQVNEEFTKRFKQEETESKTVHMEFPTDKFKDENGTWREIDDTMEKKEAEGTEDFAGFENKANDFKIKIAENLNSGKLMRIRKGNHVLEWSLAQKITTASGRVASRKGVLKANQNVRLGGTVSYREISNGVDLRYTVQDKTVKEEIVIKEKCEHYDFTFYMRTKNLALSLDESGKIIHATDGSQEVFDFPAPFMTDATGEMSSAVRYKLEEQENGYLLRVQVDESWINAKERVFPVIVDPTVSDSGAGSKVVPHRCGAASSIYVGYDQGNYYRYQFRPSIVLNPYITKATLTFTADSDQTLYVGKLLGSFNSQCFQSMTGTINTSSRYSAGNYIYTADVTSIVQAWQKGEAMYGFVIYSKENTSAGKACILNTKLSYDYQAINYPGINTDAPFVGKSFSVYGGKTLDVECGSGISAIDLFTGRQMFSIPLFCNEDGMQICLVYNSDYKKMVQFGTCLGYGWRISALESYGNCENEYNSFAYFDGVGKAHIFSKKTNKNGTFDTTNEGYYNDGGFLYLDYFNHYKHFANGGLIDSMKLNDLTDVINFEYEMVNRYDKRLKSIYTTNFTVTFTYDSKGTMSTIKKTCGSESETVTLSHTNTGMLRTVSLLNETLSFSYNGYDLTHAETSNGYYLTYERMADRISNVSEYSNYSFISSSSTFSSLTGNTWSISYSGNNARVTDRNKLVTDYFFAPGGRLIAQAEPPAAELGKSTISPYIINCAQVNVMQVQGLNAVDENKAIVFNCQSFITYREAVNRHIQGKAIGSDINSLTIGKLLKPFDNKNSDFYLFVCWVKVSGSKEKVLSTFDADWESLSNESKEKTGFLGLRIDKSLYYVLDPKDGWQFVAIPIQFTDSATEVTIYADLRCNSDAEIEIVNGSMYRTNGVYTKTYGISKSLSFDKKQYSETTYDDYKRNTGAKIYNKEDDSLIGSTSITYDDTTANPSSVTDAYGVTTVYGYTNGCCTHKTTSRNGLCMAQDAEYNTYGRVLTQSNDLGYTVTNTYSGGNLTKVQNPNGDYTSYGYTNSQLTTVTSSYFNEGNSITYNKGYPITYAHDGVTYTMSYDGFGRIIQVSQGANVKSVTYTDYGTNLVGVSGAVSSVSISHSNSYSVTSYYNKYGQALAVKEGGSVKVQCTYNDYGELKETIDNYADEVYTYDYTTDGRTESVSVKRNGSIILTKGYMYDLYDEVKGVWRDYGGYTDSYTQTKDNRGRVTSESTPLGTVSYEYDDLGKISSRTAYGNKEHYGYVTNKSYGFYTTPYVNKIIYADGTQYGYQYDKNGNILQITNSNGAAIDVYEYDDLNRLRTAHHVNSSSTLFSYDERGNIIERSEYYYCKGSLYNWCFRYRYTYTYAGDKVTKRVYNAGSVTSEETCEYDANGNPTKYFGAVLSWTRGRLLSKFGDNTFEYNAEGIRNKKNDIEYILDGDKIIAEKENGVITKRYFYDGSGIAGMWYDGEKYYFRKNLQGDVIAIYDESGERVASYSYDPWGAVLTASGTMARVNPFRYRGYYYDIETGLFLVSSRYYDPETGRFISPDDISYLDPETINGLNLYAYCLNNPINYYDPDGHWAMPNWLKWLIGGVVIVGLGIATALTRGAAGVILGAAFYGAVTGAVSGAIVNGVIGGISSAISGNGFWGGFADGAADGFMFGAIIGGATGALTSGINIATGGVKIVGTAQKTGSVFHQFASNVQAGKMSMAIGRYSKIHLNRSKGLGIKGFRPDVTGVTKNGLRVVEVVSSTQTYASQVAKVATMMGRYSHITNGLVLDGLHLLLKWFVF